MARNKTEKITISFEKSELIKKLVGDIAIKENRSLSAIIEKIILQSLLPKNSDAQWIAEQYLYADNGGIDKALSALFSNNSAGVNWEAVHDNMLPLVQYAQTQAMYCHTILSGKERELFHLKDQIQLVIEKLEKLAQEKNSNYYKKEADWGRALLEELAEEPQYSRICNFYQLLLNSWDDFKNWTITYRLLHDLVEIEKGWRSDPAARIELLQLIKKVSDEWG